MNISPYFTYEGDNGRWYWQRGGRLRTYDGDGYATARAASDAALACFELERLERIAADQRRLVELKAKAPLRTAARIGYRPPAQQDVDGLALFDVARQPNLI